MTVPASAPVARRRSLRAPLIALGLTAAALVAGVLLAQRFRPTTEAATLRLATLLPPDVIIDPSNYPILAISHDGSTVAFAGVSNGTSKLYVRRLAEFDAHALRETEGATAPFHD